MSISRCIERRKRKNRKAKKEWLSDRMPNKKERNGKMKIQNEADSVMKDK